LDAFRVLIKCASDALLNKKGQALCCPFNFEIVFKAYLIQRARILSCFSRNPVVVAQQLTTVEQTFRYRSLFDEQNVILDIT
jgi:hypothetical protein